MKNYLFSPLTPVVLCLGLAGIYTISTSDTSSDRHHEASALTQESKLGDVAEKAEPQQTEIKNVGEATKPQESKVKDIAQKPVDLSPSDFFESMVVKAPFPVASPAAALASTENNSLKLYGKGNPFTVEQLPAGELKTKLQQLDAPARQEALNRLHNISFHEFDAAKHLRVDDAGGIFTVCTGHDCHAHHPQTSTAALGSKLRDVTDKPVAPSEPRVEAAPVLISSPPKYNSKPGATYHIYLDFNGGVVQGKQWNTSANIPIWDCFPWDEDGDLETFSDAEQATMKRTWQRVAEDFAPWDVNVTTDVDFDPANNLTYDKNKVAWVLITPTSDKGGNLCPHAGAGGVAYLDVFGRVDFAQRYQPAWVAIQDGADDTFAEVTSHEVGHNLGLSHDGIGGAPYYGGHGNNGISWGPIMGASYGRNVTQWSKGEYNGANQFQDDLNIIDNKLGYRPDDHGNTAGTATPLTITGTPLVTIASTNPENDPDNTDPLNKGIIERNNDVDVFSFQTGDGLVTITVNSWITPTNTRGCNLDVSLELRNSQGDIVATANPETSTSATISENLIADTYFLFVKNTGAGNPQSGTPTGYTSYGSIGQYFISGTISESPPVLRLLSITPNEGELGSTVQALVRGRLFDPTTEISLKKSGYADIVGTLIEYQDDTSMIFEFDLTGVAIGLWDVFASSLGDTATLPDAFTVTLPVIQIFPTENFDASTDLPAGWTTYSTTDATPLWEVDPNKSNTPPNSVGAVVPSFVATKYLQSPPIAIPAESVNLELSFWQYCDLESGYDGGVLEFSIDGGDWFDVSSTGSGTTFKLNGYNKLISDQYNSPISKRRAWSGDSKGFIQSIVSLVNSTKFAGKTLRVRWLLASDNTVASGGWNIDTVAITGSILPDVGAPINYLDITSTDDLSYSGIQGGSFTPTPQSYTITNTGTESIRWTASKTTSWVTLTPTAGTLGAGASQVLSVAVNSNSIALPVGLFTDIVTITNTEIAEGTDTRNINITVDPKPATITLGNLAQTYNGSPKSVTVTTNPAGLAYEVTYDGTSVAPTSAGSYPVVATINQYPFAGSAIGTLVIAPVNTTVSTWPTAASIPLGQAVSTATLSGGSASTSGSFSYDAPGTVLGLGTHAVPVTFTPSDTTNYTTVTGTVNVTVYPTSTDLVHMTVSNVSSSGWTLVDLGKTYTSPVIVATPIYTNSTAAPVVTRIRNVTASTFELKLDRADNSSDPVNLNVAVVAVNEGVYTIPQQGVKMEAVRFTSTLTASGSKSWIAEARTFQNTYTNPVVVGQVMTYNDPRWSAFWSMGAKKGAPVSANKFHVGKHVGMDPVKTRANETMGYIVIEAGTGTMDGVRYQAVVGKDIVRSFGDSATPYTYPLTGFSSVSTAAVSQSGIDGSEGSWAVLSGNPALTTTALRLHVVEDAFINNLRKHTTEQVAFIVFE